MTTVLRLKSGTKRDPQQRTFSRETLADKRRGIVMEQLPIEQIDAHPDNPRQDWDQQDLPSLTNSVRQAGIIQPVVVRRIGERYQLVAGERRLRAAKAAKWKTVPAIVREMGDNEARAAMIHENLERKGLNPIEKAKLLSKICAPIGEGGDGKSVKEAAQLCGRKDAWVRNLVRLLKLPTVWQDRIASGEIAERRARLLVVHADSPEVLLAVERDLEANPWAWETDDAFERSLGLIVANPKAENRQADEPRAPRAAPARIEPSVSRSGAVTTAAIAAGESSARDDEIAEICATIGRLAELDQLDTIQAAVDGRRAELEAT